METIIYLLLLILAIWIDNIIARAFADAAADKGYADGKYFWMCFLFGPAGYILVAALPDRGQPAVQAPPAPAAYVQPQAVPVVTPVQHPASSAPQAYHQNFSDGSWQCTCGRKNPRYVSTCTCGKNKHR